MGGWDALPDRAPVLVGHIGVDGHLAAARPVAVFAVPFGSGDPVIQSCMNVEIIAPAALAATRLQLQSPVIDGPPGLRERGPANPSAAPIVPVRLALDDRFAPGSKAIVGQTDRFPTPADGSSTDEVPQNSGINREKWQENVVLTERRWSTPALAA